jgi:hypothetical protein
MAASGAVFALMAALAGPAAAAVETFSVDYGSAETPLATGTGENLSIDKFDPSLGVLTGVNITLYSYDTASAEVYNFAGIRASYAGATATVPITVTALGGTASTASATAGLFAGVSTGRGMIVAGSSPVIALRSASQVDAGDFGFYEGVGVVPFTVSVESTAGSYSGSSGAMLFFGGNGFSRGTVEIDYTYTATPEPGTMAAISYCGLGFARRLRLGRAGFSTSFSLSPATTQRATAL